MWSSPLFWIVVAIGVFWALGAYNRLVRLRAEAVSARAEMLGLCQQSAELVIHSLLVWNTPADMTGAEPEAALPAATLEALEAQAANLMELSGHGTRAGADSGKPAVCPSEGDVPRLDAGWHQFLEQASNAGRDTSAVKQRWAALHEALSRATRACDGRLQAYHCAIGQFPASVLARVCGFRPL
jgi:LemA protein